MKKKNFLICIMMVIIFIISSCSTEHSKNKLGSDGEISKSKSERINFQDNKNSGMRLKSELPRPELSGRKNGTNSINQNTEPTTSGQTTAVPWENDNEFKTAQAKNNSFELMAAYRTVLRDPLPGEESNVHHAARLLAGTVVEPGEVFSQNKEIGPYTEDKGFKIGPTYIGTRLSTTVGGGVCKIASTLYNATVLSGIAVIERHPHNMPVPYVPYGQDATVSYGAKDFKFKNDTSFSILIWAQGVGNTLYIGFYGKAKPPKVQWHHEMQKVYQAPKVYRLSSNLPAGTEKVVLEGMDGAIVKSWVTIENPDGTVVEKQMEKSYYNPMPYVIERNK